MSSTGQLRLPVKERRALQSDDFSLLYAIQNKANWVWAQESSDWKPPRAPTGEQRAFRKNFTYPRNKGTPTRANVIIAADDDFALYLDGVLVQPAEGTHDWRTLTAFEIPLPAIQNQTASSMLLGFRVINLGGAAGLLVGVQVGYESGEPDVFYTGLDDSWQAQTTFSEGWEQPWFQSKSWPQVDVFSGDTRSPSESVFQKEEATVFDALPASVASGVCSAQTHNVGLSRGGLAGVIIGTALVALVIGIIGTYFSMRKRSQPVGPGNNAFTRAPAVRETVPATLAGGPQFPLANPAQAPHPPFSTTMAPGPPDAAPTGV
ncbi:hypothetical protein FA13DRAFT_1074400 [Coprinellus micaceus]|uniref:Uncharacterized protein n=1 Tax=Coprinellus micaceus TaxID=71717 RepID=A0A4Y7TR14_COPMI|nr:hypothetical protein FA13DRAFT_1074400 [Coprinellus micaceus]